jgi:hypothetical protein
MDKLSTISGRLHKDTFPFQLPGNAVNKRPVCASTTSVLTFGINYHFALTESIFFPSEFQGVAQEEQGDRVAELRHAKPIQGTPFYNQRPPNQLARPVSIHPLHFDGVAEQTVSPNGRSAKLFPSPPRESELQTRQETRVDPTTRHVYPRRVCQRHGHRGMALPRSLPDQYVSNNHVNSLAFEAASQQLPPVDDVPANRLPCCISLISSALSWLDSAKKRETMTAARALHRP